MTQGSGHPDGPAAFDPADASVVLEDDAHDYDLPDPQRAAPGRGTGEGAKPEPRPSDQASSEAEHGRAGARHARATRRSGASGKQTPPGDVAVPVPGPQDPGAARAAARAEGMGSMARGLASWGGIFMGALGALVMLWLSLSVTDFVAALMAREGWLGWLAFGLFLTLTVAAFALAVREVTGIFALRRLKHLRANADTAWRQDDAQRGRAVVKGLTELYAGRPDVALALHKLNRGGLDIAGGRDAIGFADRELASALDGEARQIVSTAAQRVALFTALSPGAVLDIAIVAAQTLRMLRQLAQLYGGRPGFFGLMRLARRVLSHLVMTGGIALTLDLAQDLLGKRVAGMVAGKLGEGVFNGALTARLGIAAIEVCRPVPHVVSDAVSVRAIVSELISSARAARQT